MYIKRHSEEAVKMLSKMFGAVLVSGSRQVGKTTMLKNIINENKERPIGSVTLDDPILLESAKNQPMTFFKDNTPPIFIDEVQKAPELFPQIKMLIDSSGEKGGFYLCGSQQFHMMKNVSESLAGRLGIVNLLPLSMREICKTEFNEPFLPTDSYFEKRKGCPSELEYNEIWRLIQRGSMPELTANPDFDSQLYYGSYVTTYIERDVRELTQVGDTIKFTQFMAVMAGRTGRLLNLKSAADDVGISQSTAERWLSVLTASNIVYLLKPYSNNLTKRAVKTPKLYFLDTGLAAYLTKWNSPEALKSGAMAGEFFETFVVSEVLKSYYNKGISDPPLYFYRDKEKKEIDLIIEDNNTLYPIEIKKHSDPRLSDVSSFSVLDKIGGINRGSGGVVCLYDNLVTLKDNDRVIPLKYI